MRPPKPFSHYVIPVPESGCHLWTGSWDRKGYGHTGYHKQAHRVAYEIAYGEIPDGMVIRHKCDTPACVNPSHLEAGSILQNVRDRVIRGRGARGEKSGQSKLTAKQVMEIRSMRGKVTQFVLAERYVVHQTTISQVLAGKNWGWVQ